MSILVSQTTYLPQHNRSFLYTTASWPSPISWNHCTAQDLGLKPKGINQRRPRFLSHQAGQALLRWGVAKSSRGVHNCAGQWFKITWPGKGTCPSKSQETSFNLPFTMLYCLYYVILHCKGSMYLLLLALLQNQIYSKKISEDDITLTWKGFLSNPSPAIKEVSVISLHRSWGEGEILARKYLTPNRKVTFSNCSKKRILAGTSRFCAFCCY